MLPGVHIAARTLEEFSLEYVDIEGVVRREHLWTEVVHKKQSWATLLVCYRERKVGGWEDPCFKLVRLRWAHGMWSRISTFNLKQHHLNGVQEAVARAMGGEK